MPSDRTLPRALPGLAAIAGWILLWEGLVRLLRISPFVLPSPSSVALALTHEAAALAAAAWVTVQVTWLALALAVASGTGLALAMHHSRLAEAAIRPFAVLLQVTPVVAIAPLVLIWSGVDRPHRALVLIAWIVALFPVLSGVGSALRAVDPSLRDLFRLYRAGRWQRLILLDLPASLPGLLGATKIAAGLALIGAIVGEFAAGSGQSQGLAWAMLEAQFRLDLPAMFACLVVLAALGMAHYALLDWLERVVLAARGLSRPPPADQATPAVRRDAR